MRFLLLAYGNEDKFEQMSQAERATLYQQCMAFDAELQATGKVVSTGSLSWRSKAMRRKTGKLAVTDGPFLDTKEVVGGVLIIEAEDFDEAVRVASLHPAARTGEELGWGIELRPMELCALAADQGAEA